ncbi:hypothetical protein ANN_11134 [Periplaneta americana]|uniref:BESS domain-containing protein n=1 Tax=Periplaneta americana TaxID=6978 RepID=A0ABQ8T462_PERAM|nr:hypothetical protein ANN_11134 [Periplaneta americana]
MRKGKNREAQNNSIDKMIQVMKDNAALRQIKYQERQEKAMDETDMFFMSMCKMTKKLPPYEQTKIKLTLSNAVLQAQMTVQEKDNENAQQQLQLTRPLSAPSSLYIFPPQDDALLSAGSSRSTAQDINTGTPAIVSK